MFQFMTATRIIFGEGALQSSLSVINQFGYSVLLVTGKDTQRATPIINYLKAQNMRYQHVAINGEPNITMVEETAVLGRKFQPDMVIAIGGGSVIDMGKALAAIIPNQGDVYDYVEVVGRNVPLKTKPIHFIAIPTTASTGSEVTRNAVLKSGQDQVKVSLRSPEMLADVAIVDPTLTYGTDQYTSGRGAMDAFTHLMEAYVCGDPNPLTDMVCEEGLRRLSRSVIAGCKQDSHKARADLSFAALLGGMAITNAKLGAAHGLASALGGKLDAPHSVITARLAPHVMQENINAAKRAGRSDVISRYKRLAQLVTERTNANEHDGVLWVRMVLDKLELPQLGKFGVCQTSFEQVADDALKSVAIKGNPLPLTQDRLVYILRQVCDCSDACMGESEGSQHVSSVEVLESRSDLSDVNQ
ncbi:MULTISPECIES: iron-containing alcohol dehydrogenase [Vibrio harveyi group]|uniref:Iron-containing alcohol dehydrogenase n=2 Tax=Vibrio campbellii TaxID=680 RepID=A0AAQ3AYS5_9VIBR|nr:iron-containing alcohol dehydrogenase [Vibrio campbellii]EDL67348.1 iron-containing alcohol dehydrogenase [Vibrio campbellii HY01]MCC8255017.1 iron-containing alcohol dehydrogenase [Vibrio campbellii CAIM 333]UMM01881.1 iron-containing alcohol dehydrogenase [Vibrio campbellii]WDG07171.1 iron-containing alcohol dehydrogenase [Vibrio campbellii]HDM8227524.1 iron-containing alcohol dehydrogenase [Vibrio campbellii]